MVGGLITRVSGVVVTRVTGKVRRRAVRNRRPLQKIPSTFKDTPAIIKALTTHILEEGLMVAEQEFVEHSTVEGVWIRPTMVLDLVSQPRNLLATSHLTLTTTPD